MPEIKALIDWLIDLSFNSYNSIRQKSPLSIEHDNVTIIASNFTFECEFFNEVNYKKFSENVLIQSGP